MAGSSSDAGLVHRFDHAIIGVRDLRAASARFSALGLTVVPGGVHPGRGTHNATIRFGLDYLELLSIRDRQERESSGASGARLLEFLDRGEGLFGWVVATRDAEALAARMRGHGVEASTFGMQRTRPDGRVLRWKLLNYGDRAAGAGPGVIDWETADADRLNWETPTAHPLGVEGVDGVVVQSPDPAALGTFYVDEFGLQREGDDLFTLGRSWVELRRGDGQTAGLSEVVLHVRDIEKARTFLHDAGVDVGPQPGHPERLAIPLEAACGARLVLTG